MMICPDRPRTWDNVDTHDCWPHEWTLVDRTPNGVTPTDENRDWYLCVECEKCGGIRCSAYTPGAGIRCEHVRHHRSPHLYPDGSREEVGA